jgi:hypothetical protein
MRRDDNVDESGPDDQPADGEWLGHLPSSLKRPDRSL